MRKLVVLVAALGLVAVGAVAWASIPDANGVIHGCRKTSGGALRVIDSDVGQTCSGNEAGLNWNQTGPQGPPGVSGYEIVSTTLDPPDSSRHTTTVTCPTGKKALSGGLRESSNTSWDSWNIFGSYPTADGTGWSADYFDALDGSTVTVYAICGAVT